MLPTITDTANSIDWTSVIISAITGLVSVFAAFMASKAAQQAKLNAVMLHTNSGMTIGQHIEKFQEDQLVLRDELQSIARQKLKDDAVLAAASLEAIAKLSAAANVNMQETARTSAEDLMAKADRTAHLLTQEGKNEPASVTADELVAVAGRTAHRLAGTTPPRTAKASQPRRRTAKKS